MSQKFHLVMDQNQIDVIKEALDLLAENESDMGKAAEVEEILSSLESLEIDPINDLTA